MADVRKVAVIGAGIMGLTCAYELLKKGYKVTVYESSDRIGGMSETFDFGSFRLEKFYHFVCGPDRALFDFMQELGIYDKLKWTETKMGFFYEGRLYKWGNPLALLAFPKASFWLKIRYGLHIFLASKRRNWRKLDQIKVLTWIHNWVGEKGYQLFWRPLFEYKFYEYKQNISAAWLWSRLRRVGLSRKNIFTERMGYIEGSSDTLLNAVADRIKVLGGTIKLGTSVQEILYNQGQVRGLKANGKAETYEQVISTMPLPYLPKLFDRLPASLEVLHRLENVAVVCVILKMDKALTENFWLNVNTQGMEIPGIIEFSNLNPLPEKILYVPFYMHRSHPKYQNNDQQFIQETLTYLEQVNPGLIDQALLDSRVFRYEYAQPVCEMGYLESLPPIKSELEGFYMMDTSYYYPEDRSQSESIRLARELISKYF